jgi:hypothetical protein
MYYDTVSIYDNTMVSLIINYSDTLDFCMHDTAHDIPIIFGSYIHISSHNLSPRCNLVPHFENRATDIPQLACAGQIGSKSLNRCLVGSSWQIRNLQSSPAKNTKCGVTPSAGV